jgi:hypothetical protein
MEKHDLTMDELIDILQKGDTWAEIKDAVKSHEITEEELNKVLAFVKERDPEKAKQLFQDILGNIKEQPTFDTNEDLQKWSTYRETVANKVAELLQEQRDCEKEMSDLKNTIDTFEQKIKENKDKGKEVSALLEAIEGDKEQLALATERLAVRTKQIAALQLVELHAQSPERQQDNFHRAQTREPLIETLKRAWTLYREHAKSLRQVVEQTKDLSRPQKQQDKLNKMSLDFAKKHVKEYNKLKSSIEKEEAKLLKAARKIADKEFRQNKHLNRLEHWSQGTPLDKDLKPLIIKDLDMAKEIIENATVQISPWQQSRMEAAQKNLDEMTQLKREHEEAATKALGEIAEKLHERRKGVQQAIDQVVEHEKNGDLGHVSNRKMNQIERNLKDAMDYTYIDPDLLQGSLFQKDLDMAGFMKDHGMDNLILQDEHEIGGNR